jgi:hypothetical protein
MTTTSRITPFANGSEYLSWLEGNCLKCRKYAPDAMSVEDGACEIELALGEGSVGDGSIESSIYNRMGQKTGKCTEFSKIMI